jgi:hypothetical protein
MIVFAEGLITHNYSVNLAAARSLHCVLSDCSLFRYGSVIPDGQSEFLTGLMMTLANRELRRANTIF